MDVLSSSLGNHVVSPVSQMFLRLYHQYTRLLMARVHQLVGDDFLLTVAVKLVQLKFCVNARWPLSVIDFDFIPNVSSYD